MAYDEAFFALTEKIATAVGRYRQPEAGMAYIFATFVRALDSDRPDSYEVMNACVCVAALWSEERRKKESGRPPAAWWSLPDLYVSEEINQNLVRTFIDVTAKTGLKYRTWISGRQASFVTGYTQRHLRRLAKAGLIEAKATPVGAWRYAPFSLMTHAKASRGPYRKGSS